MHASDAWIACRMILSDAISCGWTACTAICGLENQNYKVNLLQACFGNTESFLQDLACDLLRTA